MYNKIISLDEHIIRSQRNLPYASGELSSLLRDIGLASKIVSREVNKAGLVDIAGRADVENTSGDDVQKLDVLANDLLISCLRNSGECCGIASEEEDSFKPIETQKTSKYVVLFDPLDGSSNIDVNVSIGTIFAIYRRRSFDGECNIYDFLQKGDKQVAAGYVLYGSSTMLVYTTGRGVNGFTLDPSIGEFCLSHPNIQIPKDGTIYSVNQANYNSYTEGAKAYIDHCMNSNYTQRYIGSMVADVHRTLIKGGIFFYPATKSKPEGKLRLLYECNPLAMLIEGAGGKASNGRERILDIEPHELHQKTGVYMGSPMMVEKAEACIREAGRNTTDIHKFT